MEKVTYYKKHNGNILKWEIEVINHGKFSTIITYSGELKAKQRINTTKVLTGKNIGKANETTHYVQAVKEADSRMHKKRMEGYNPVSIPTMTFIEGIEAVEQYLKDTLVEGIDFNGNIKPMLAVTYFKSSKNFKDPTGKVWKDRKYYYLKNPYGDIPSKHIAIEFPCECQVKLNGVRCLAHITKDEVKLFSREGTPYNVKSVITPLYQNRKKILEVFDRDYVILDGELYIHGESLETINSAVRGETNLFTPPVDYYVYDTVLDSPFFLRYDAIRACNDFLTGTSIKIVETFTCRNHKAAQRFTDFAIKKGYEGAMFRNNHAPYEPNKRKTNILVKLKRTIQKEFTVIDIVPQEKDNDLGLFLFRTEEGSNFEVNPTFNKLTCGELLINKAFYIGKAVTLTFYEYTEYGIPKHVIDTIFRDYE